MEYKDLVQMRRSHRKSASRVRSCIRNHGVGSSNHSKIVIFLESMCYFGLESLQQLPIPVPFQDLHLLNSNLVELHKPFALWHSVID